MAGAALLIVGNNNATSTFSGSLQDGTATGGLSLAKVGSGTLTLNGASTFSAGTTINAGTVQAGNDSALGTGNLTLAGGALTSNGTTAYSLPNPLVLSGGATLGDPVNNGALTFTASSGTLTANAQLTINSPVTINANLSGSGFGLTKAGSGTLTLTGESTYTGPTVIAGGTLQLTALSPYVGIKFATNRGGGAYQVTGSAGAVPMSNWNNLTGQNQPVPQSLQTSYGVPSAATVSWSGVSDNWDVFNANQTDQNAQLLNSYLDNTSSGGSELINVSGVPYSQYNVYVYFGSDGNGRQGQVTIGGTTYYYSTAANNSTVPYPLTQTTDTSQTYPAANYAEFTDLTGSSFTVNQIESSNNGITAVEIVGTSGSYSNELPVTTALTIAAGAALDLGGLSQQVASLSNSGSGGGSIINRGPVAAVLTLSATGGSSTFSGTIDGTVVSPISLVMSGSGRQVLTGSLLGQGSVLVDSGTLILSGSDSYTGGTAVSGGTLEVTSGSALPAGQSLAVGASGTFIFDPTATAAPLTASAGLAVTAVPEPSTLALLGMGAVALLAYARRRRKQMA